VAWYVRQRGETVGPVDDATLERWIRDGMHDVEVREGVGGEWVPVEKSRFAHLPAPRDRLDSAAGRLQLCVAGAGAAAVLSFIIFMWIVRAKLSPPRVAVDVDPAMSAVSVQVGQCLLAIPESRHPVRVLDTWDDSAAMEAGALDPSRTRARFLEALRRSNQWHLVTAGTPCTYIEWGAVTSRVLVGDGPLRGRQVWALTEWTRGEARIQHPP
jgi:hypothetical protein